MPPRFQERNREMKKVSKEFIAVIISMIYSLLINYKYVLGLDLPAEPSNLKVNSYSRKSICYFEFEVPYTAPKDIECYRVPFQIQDLFNGYLNYGVDFAEKLPPYYDGRFLSESLYVSDVWYNEKKLYFKAAYIDSDAAAALVHPQYKTYVGENQALDIPEKQKQLRKELSTYLRFKPLDYIDTSPNSIVPIGFEKDISDGEIYYHFLFLKSPRIIAEKYTDDYGLYSPNYKYNISRINNYIAENRMNFLCRLYGWGEKIPEVFSEIYRQYPLTINGIRCVECDDYNNTSVKYTFILYERGDDYEE